LAVLAVLVFHADPVRLPGGFLGVDLFFVISGYLITRILLGELGRTGGLDLTRFYLRRAVRLLPAVLVLLAAVTVTSTLIWRDETATVRGSVLSTLCYVGNWWLIGAHQSYFVASGRPPMLQHPWSLAIEEQFYLIWPLALTLLAAGSHRWWRRLGRGEPYPDRWPLPRRFGTVTVVSVLLALASTSIMAALAIRDQVPYGSDSSRIYFGSDTHSMGLLLGAAFGAMAEKLAFQPPRSWRIRRWFTDLLGLTALVGMAVLAYRVNEFSPELYRGGFLAVSAVAVVLVSTVARPGSRLGRLLDQQPLRWLGDRSYSIYLWHWPVIVVTRPGVDLPDREWLVLGIRLVAPLLLATASYSLIERPARRLGEHYLAGRDRRAEAAHRSRPSLRPSLVGVFGLAMVFVLVLAIPARPGSALQPAAAIGTQPSAVDTSATGTSGATEDRPPTSGSAFLGPGRPRPGAVHSTGQKRPARPSRAPGQLAVSAFGDSVMLGAQATLAAEFSRCDLHAVEGRQPYATLQDVRAAHGAGRLAPVVAIHTGNNGVIRADDLRSTLRLLTDRQRVVLLTDRVSMDWRAPNNLTIKSVAREFGNVVVLDWYARSNGDRSWFYGDGLHLRPVGAANYAKLIAQAAG
jgi:peptidoglycan/LPS O-acetylase OafA/YrhL